MSELPIEIGDAKRGGDRLTNIAGEVRALYSSHGSQPCEWPRCGRTTTSVKSIKGKLHAFCPDHLKAAAECEREGGHN